jgi:hypothetical protein
MTPDKIVNFLVGEVMKAGRRAGLHFAPLAVRAEVVRQLEATP